MGTKYVKNYDTGQILIGSEQYIGLTLTDTIKICQSKGKIFLLQIWNNNTLIRDFVPAFDENGTVCMYDKVTKQFFYNAGTGDFIAGPVIE